MFNLNTEVTFVVSTKGNTQALAMCLMSIGTQTAVPGTVIVRMEGEMLKFSDFYLEQACDFLRKFGVDLQLRLSVSRGVRTARTELMKAAKTELVWMGDDDCLYRTECLAELLVGLEDGTNRVRDNVPLAWVQGAKPDINNRRGYKDFSAQVREGKAANNHEGYNFFFTGEGKTVLCDTLDTGNVLFTKNVRYVREHLFAHNEKEFNSSGEDTLAALYLQSKGYFGVFRTSAGCIHLEKPTDGFDEFSARKNYIQATAENCGYPTAPIANVLPWVK